MLCILLTLCNTIIVPGFQVLHAYFNCLGIHVHVCLKPMEKRLHSAQTLILRLQHKTIRIYCDKTNKTRKFLYCRSCGLIKKSTCMVNRQRQSIITHNGSEMILFSRFASVLQIAFSKNSPNVVPHHVFVLLSLRQRKQGNFAKPP